jgi:enamine deaminase RidA (YjgF/YER057c/UK114 family)
MNEGEIAAGLAQTSNYQYAQRVGTRLFLAGQVPRDGEGRLVGEGDAAAQAGQCLRNLFTLIDHHGFGRADIRRLIVYVVGPHSNLLDAWGEVARTFDMNVPPATLLGVHLLGYTGQLVEIDATVMSG